MNEIDLSIVIPTTGKSMFLDRAIGSCLRHLNEGMEIVIFVNNPKGLLCKSAWRDCPKIKWVFSSAAEILPANISWSNGINHSKGSHILVLSDDDELGPDFDWQAISGSASLKSSTSILLQHATLLEEGHRQKPRLRNNILFDDVHLDAARIFDLALRNKISQHISLLIFCRDLLTMAGAYQDLGFSNGYFSDTLMNLRVLSDSKEIKSVAGQWVIRRTGPHQGSSEFDNDLSVLNKVDFFANQLLAIDKYTEALSKYGLRPDGEHVYLQRANYVLGNVSRSLRGIYGNRFSLVLPSLGLLFKALMERRVTMLAIWKALLLKFFGIGFGFGK